MFYSNKNIIGESKDISKDISRQSLVRNQSLLNRDDYGHNRGDIVYLGDKADSNEYSTFYDINSHVDKSAVIKEFWAREFNKAQMPLNFKSVKLPLARIKRLMKVEEDVKIIAQEVPILFAFVTEKFIEDLTLRAWLYTKEGKRKILQGTDIFKAVKTTKMYDFLRQMLHENETSDFAREAKKN